MADKVFVCFFKKQLHKLKQTQTYFRCKKITYQQNNSELCFKPKKSKKNVKK